MTGKRKWINRFHRTRTPLRVAHGQRKRYARILRAERVWAGAFAIDKHLYVVVKRHAEIFEEQYRLSYSQSEIRSSLDK